MAKLLIIKTERGLEPATEESRTIVNKWKVGDSYAFEYKKARNPKFHRLVFGVANLVCDNTDEWNEPLLFIKAVQLTYGYVKIMYDCTGIVHQTPTSISFESMEEPDFRKFYEECLLVEACRILNTDPITLKEQLPERF